MPARSAPVLRDYTPPPLSHAALPSAPHLVRSYPAAPTGPGWAGEAEALRRALPSERFVTAAFACLSLSDPGDPGVNRGQGVLCWREAYIEALCVSRKTKKMGEKREKWAKAVFPCVLFTLGGMTLCHCEMPLAKSS